MKVDPNSNPTHTLYSGLPLSSESPRPYHTIPYYSFYSNPLHSILFLHYITMTISPSSLSFLAVLAVFSLLFAASVHAQAPAPAPTSDGISPFRIALLFFLYLSQLFFMFATLVLINYKRINVHYYYCHMLVFFLYILDYQQYLKATIVWFLASAFTI